MNVLDHREYGDSALVFEAVHCMLDADDNVYREIRPRISLALLARLRAQGIEFAYPTRTLHLRHRTSGLAGPAGGIS